MQKIRKYSSFGVEIFKMAKITRHCYMCDIPNRGLAPSILNTKYLGIPNLIDFSKDLNPDLNGLTNRQADWRR